MGPCSACVVFDESLTSYNFGPDHPMNPIRVDFTMRLAGQLGGARQRRHERRAADGGGPARHRRRAAHGAHPGADRGRAPLQLDPAQVAPGLGLGTDDNPTFVGMHEAARHVVGASIEAARRVWQGDYLHAANVAGGLHHAMPERASGFCDYNDLAIAIRWLLDQGAQKVAYVDLDVHHGDGVEQVFWTTRAC